MSSDLKNHYTGLNRAKRKAYLISLNDNVDENSEYYRLEDILSGGSSLLNELEQKLILHELYSKTTKEKFDITILTNEGYGVKEVAGRYKITMKKVREILDEIYGLILEICYEDL